MKQYFVDNKSDKLVVIFCGWGSNQNCFDLTDKTADFLVLYDYRTPDFDYEIVNKHKTVRVFAWSLGVWAANAYFKAENPAEAVAYNGTLFPVDDCLGIPPAIFDGTIANFSERSLYKFRRRMCGGNAEDFSARCAGINTDDLGDELKFIRSAYNLPGKLNPMLNWKHAYYGQNDKIFTPQNQLAAWQKLSVPCKPLGNEHYDSQAIDEIIKTLLQ